MQIENIPAKPKEQKTIRVVAYARVSSDKDSAFHSLTAQREYYEEYISHHPNWELVGLYSDNGISGTIIERPEFQRMLTDCRAGKVDLVITKSITRFARNAVVLLETIRELKELGIDCYFEKEQMHSISPDGELLLTLLAMYAEEEARSASENQKWRIKRKFENGEPWVGNMLGYRLVDGKLTIVPEEAEIVKRIFSEFLAGNSITSIAKKLNRDHIPPAYSHVWQRETITSILKNEKYAGDMLLQKTYRTDFRTKKKRYNRGQLPMYRVVGSHEPIISKEDYDKVQQLFQQNRDTRATAKTNKKDNVTNLRIFSGLIQCGECGHTYSLYFNNAGKYKRPVWQCSIANTLTKLACPAKAIPERILLEQTSTVLAEYLGITPEELPTLTNEYLKAYIIKITVPTSQILVYSMVDGSVISVEWEHRSRRESWTPEMKQKARERALKQNAERRRKNAGNTRKEN